MALKFNHAKLASFEDFIANNDIEKLVLDQLGTMHRRVCRDSDEHVKLMIGPNEGKCKHCLKMIAVPIEEPIEEPIGPGP